MNRSSGPTARRRALQALLSALFGLVLLTPLAARAQTERGMPCGGMEFSNGQFTAQIPCVSHPGAPAPPPKPDQWAAVAISPSTTHGGFAMQQASKAAAAAQALSACKQKSGGASDCRVEAVDANQCFSVAVSRADRIIQIGQSPSRTFAMNNAAARCRGAGGRMCEIVGSTCADGEQHATPGRTVYSNGNPIFVPEGSSGGLRRY